MSYILDALRRADAERERERGAVPGLHAQPPGAAAVLMNGPAAAGVRWQWRAMALALSLGLLAALSWWLWQRAAPPASVVAAGPAPAAAALPAAGTRLPAAMPGLVAGAAPGAPLSTPEVALPAGQAAPPGQADGAANAMAPRAPLVQPPMPHQPLPSAGPAPLNPAPATRAPAPKPAPSPAPVEAPVPAEAAAVAAAATKPAVPRATPWAELSPAQRSELPPMAIGGSIYSDSAASRFIIVNGQVVREGESPAPGVTVERIGPKAAVLRWRDLRLEVPL